MSNESIVREDGLIIKSEVVDCNPNSIEFIHDQLKRIFEGKPLKIAGKDMVGESFEIFVDMNAVVTTLCENGLSIMPKLANQKVVELAIDGNLPVPPEFSATTKSTNNSQSIIQCVKTSISEIVANTSYPNIVRNVQSAPGMLELESNNIKPLSPEHSSVTNSPTPDDEAPNPEIDPSVPGDFLQNLQGYLNIMNAMQAMAPVPVPPPVADDGQNILANFFNLFNPVTVPPESSQPDPAAGDNEASTMRLPWSRRGKRIPCEFCDERFSSREEARVHSETVHIELFQYTCMEENCKKRYKARQGLATHCSKTGHLMPPPNLPSYYAGPR